MADQSGTGICSIAVAFLLLNSAFRRSEAGDFALIADLDNGTIYAGSIGQALSDISPLPLSGVKRPIAVDYDPVEKMVYWSDLESHPSSRISRAHLDGSNQMIVVDYLNLPDGLALDVDARMIYWTESNLGRIERARMDGTGNKEILVTNLDNPRTIITDQSNGHIYWTDWGNSSRIERADLDGSNRMTLVDDGLVWPNGVTKHGNLLYWCDASLDKIERSDLNGNNRAVVIDLTNYDVLHPFDLTVYNGHVYWTDWATTTINRVLINGQGEHNYGPSIFQQPGGIHIEEEPNYCESSPCLNEGTCVDIINGFRCYCPAGFQGMTCPEMAHCAFSLNPSDNLMVLSGQRAVYLPGDSVQYACPDGYQLSGSAIRFCQSDFTWSGQPATCIQQDPCDSDPCVNGRACTRVSGGFTCQCLAGYDGQTCETVAQCVLDLSDVILVVPPRMAVYVPGNSVTFDCPVGYQLSGPAVRFCQTDFTWSGQPAECIPEDFCASGPCVNGGTCRSEAGGFACQCPAGYNGPTCAIVVGCQRPATSSHVTLIEADTVLFPVGEVATFICDNNYVVRGSTDHSGERVCRSDGTWSGERVECSPVNTTEPGTEKSYMSAISGGIGGAILLIVILIALIVFIKRKGIRNGARTVRVPVIEAVAGANYKTQPPPYVYEQSHIYEETVFGHSNQPTETSKSSMPPQKENNNNQPPTYLEIN